MKHLWGILFIVAVAILGMMPVSVSAAGTNNFTISSYDIQYELSRDDEQHSTLTTTETITAYFPSSNQNHGLERALPKKYNGHTTNLAVQSVTDGEGNTLQYSRKSDDDGNLIVRIGDPNSYVHGAQTYRIVYTQQNVTRYYGDTGRDEWYWDTNGTDWKVPIYRLTLSVQLGEGLAAAQATAPVCYQGESRSSAQCEVEQDDDGLYRAEVLNLRAGENATLAFGFTRGTFVQYQPTFFERVVEIWKFVMFAGTMAGFAAIIGLSIAYGRKRNRQSELHTIPVEYIPPKQASVMVAARVVTPRGSAFSAQLIDFAVRHIIAIIETRPKGTFRAAEYDIKILQDVSSLADEEREILEDMFGKQPAVGERLALSSLRSNGGYTLRTFDNDRKLKLLIRGKYGIREKSKPTSQFFYNWAIVLGILGLVTVTLPLVIIAVIVAVMGTQIRPLTDKGLELRRYLLGLERYIKAAETERLKFLQGPDTAQKVGETVDVNNPAQIVKLYERVLPYAILFGQEKEWTKRLGEFYDTTKTSPDWYVGSTVFNAALFASTISAFSNAASYSGGSSSSSSGGSGGGGFSGGGGGGGGGGGW